MRNREIGYALMRATFGVIFVTTGIAKFLGGIGNFVGGMNQRFSGKLTPISLTTSLNDRGTKNYRNLELKR